VYHIPNGQNQSMRVPNMQHPAASPPARWGREAYDISAAHDLTSGPSWGGYNVPQPGDAVQDGIARYAEQLHSIPGYAAGRRGTVALHGRVGSVFDPGVFGTRGLGNVIVQDTPDFARLNGLRGADDPWYKDAAYHDFYAKYRKITANPVYVGLGVLAVAGVTYLLVSKKKRR